MNPQVNEVKDMIDLKYTFKRQNCMLIYEGAGRKVLWGVGRSYPGLIILLKTKDEVR